jgi:signal transduction histidine kinase
MFSAAIMFSTWSTPTAAMCWIGDDAEVGRLQERVDVNPRDALPKIEREIALIRAKGQSQSERLGWLLGARATAALLGSDHKKAYASQEEGLSIARKTANPSLEIDMLFRGILISGPSPDQQAQEAALRRLSELRSGFSSKTRENLCAGNAIVILLRTLGKSEEALRLAGDIYREAKRHNLHNAGAFTTLQLSAIMLKTGDAEEADALARELETYSRRSNDGGMLAHALYQRAHIAMTSNRPADAVRNFLEYTAFAPVLGMPRADGVAGVCESYLMLSKPSEALPYCRLALKEIDKEAGKIFRAEQTLAEALVQTGAIKEAKPILDRLIATPMPPQLAERYDRVLELRALAHYREGEFREAYDLQFQASANAAARRKATREEEIAKLRAQFAWDRQRIANAELERDLAKTAAQARVRQTWLMTAIGWTVLLVAMLIWIVYSSRRHRRRLEALANEAREIARSKADLLSTMSHEIRSPLGSLTLAASNLANSKEIPITSKDKALRVSVAAERLLRQLEDLLLFSRLDAKQLPLAVQSFEPQSLVERAASLLTDQAGAVGIAIDVIIKEGTPIIVEGDSGRVSQIVSNLLENAIKHSGGSRIEVLLGSESADRYYIEVSDNGQGMTAESRERAMQKFVQVGKPSSSGFGLGLSICKGLTDLMGGELSLSPSASGGLTVRLDLPVTATESFTSRAEPSMRQTQPA